MRGRVSSMRLLALLLFVSLGATGCMQQYVPPSAQQPHAIAKFRRSYVETPGSSLYEELIVNDTWAFRKTDSSELGQVPRTDAVLLHPGRPIVTLEATFSHQTTRSVTETYSCGSSTSPSTCTRTVSRSETVVDGHCKQSMALVIREGTNYLLQLNYQDSNNCTASCFIQTQQADGSFSNSTCERYTPKAD